MTVLCGGGAGEGVSIGENAERGVELGAAGGSGVGLCGMRSTSGQEQASRANVTSKSANAWAVFTCLLPKTNCSALAAGIQAGAGAMGFVRFTMEEDGVRIVIVRPDVYQGYYKLLRNCFLLIVEGTIQKQGGILNVLAEGGVGM